MDDWIEKIKQAEKVIAALTQLALSHWDALSRHKDGSSEPDLDQGRGRNSPPCPNILS